MIEFLFKLSGSLLILLLFVAVFAKEVEKSVEKSTYQKIDMFFGGLVVTMCASFAIAVMLVIWNL
jgi:Mn2+/Fe2+ NRAMP family transporter